ncbi:MAG TPA: DUF6249 domain-containing protein [Bacillota bacterium]
MNWMLILIVLMVLAVMVFAFLVRYFIHLERMALIKKGFIPPALASPIFRRGSFGLLLAGLITAFSGIGLLAGLYFGLGKGYWLIGGFLPTGVGLALVFAYLVGGGNGAEESLSLLTPEAEAPIRAGSEEE